MADNPKLEALLHESTQVHEGIQRLYAAVYTGFGAVMPAAIGVFLLVTSKAPSDVRDGPTVGLIFLAAYSLGSLWLGSLWMELLAFLRYRYVVLYPLIYAASGQHGRSSLLEYVSPRPLRSWLPSLLFQLGGLGFAIWVWEAYVHECAAPPGHPLLGLVFIALAFVGGLAVMSEVNELQKTVGRARAAEPQR